MSLVQDILDRFSRLASDRAPWEAHWLDIARYVLPNAERFDRMFAGGSSTLSAIDTVVSAPVAAERSQDVYDQTSVWAVVRGAAGEISLITPQKSTWHDLALSDPFAPDPTDEEQKWLEKVRDYLFDTRANPYSGFWTNHKAALRCKWAFGTAVMFVEPVGESVSAPVGYTYLPLSENYLATDSRGIVDTNYRLFTKSARQCVQEFGTAVSGKVREMAEDPKQKDKPVTLLQAVQPRAEKGRYGNTNRDSKFSSCVIEVGEQHLIGESGFFEFPFRVDHWDRNSPMPYSEGPVAYCLAEVKSLNEMAKSELIASQQWIAPPMITHEDVNGVRLDLNPNAINAGYMSTDGRALAAPLVTATRPDFAQTVLDTRRKAVGQMTYLDMWQTIIQSERQMTAFETMLRDQERADAIGPIGTSSQIGLFFMVERELGILARMGAFGKGSPLEVPKSLEAEDIGARFTSPLDRARKLGEFQGATQLVTISSQLEGIRPGTMDKIDVDEFVDYAQETLGAPRRIMTGDEELAGIRGARQEAAEAQAMAEDATRAAQTVAATAGSAEALSESPAASKILESLAGVSARAA